MDFFKGRENCVCVKDGIRERVMVYFSCDVGGKVKSKSILGGFVC